MNKKIVWLPYDFDTALGINNEGALTFGYNLEDTDHLAGDTDVFNGQDSVVWNNMRDAFADEIKAMYQQLRSQGTLSYAVVETAFDEHQDKWGEAIFNEDSYFKYLAPLVAPDSGAQPTASYLSMLQGSKREQRKWWLYNRFRYMDSKYNAGDSLSDVIQLRGYAKANVTVTPYADVYASVKYGSYLVQERGARNVPSTLVCPIDTLNDTEIYIYSASQLSDVGDLSGLKVGFADFSNGTKLSSLKIGDVSSGYNNPNLKTLYVGTNGLLSTIDVRNCSALGTDEQTTVDLSGCTNIEYVYFGGTAIKGCLLPNGGVLKVLQLPSTITNLTIMNQPSITQLDMPSYANITTLRIENVSSAVDVEAILDGLTANSRVRIIGLNITVSSTDEVDAFYADLDTMRGLDEHGNNVDKAQVQGTIHGLGTVSGAWMAQAKAKYPNIDIEYEHITSTLYYYDYEGVNVLHSETFTDGGDGTYSGTPSKASTPQYDYTFVGWSLEAESDTADPNATKNVVYDRNVYAAYTATVRTYTVTFVKASVDGGGTLQTLNNVAYGTTPTYTGSTPTTTRAEHVFDGWTPDLAPITGNTTYTAKFKDASSQTRKFLQGKTIDELTLPNITSIGSMTFYYKSNIKNISLPNVTNISQQAFMYCSALESISMPKLTTISDSAFYACNKLSNINIPNVNSIDNNAFYNCKSLTSIDLSKVTSIGSNAFSQCTNLSDININWTNVTEIGSSAFAYTKLNANLIDLPNITILGSSIFRNTNIKSANLPNVTIISDSVFAYCSNLTSINVPNATSIGSNVFQNCTSLTSIDLPKVTSIGSSTFNGCTSLASVNVSNIERVGASGFEKCTNLTSIDLPKVNFINNYSFYNCTGLTSVTLRYNGVCTLGDKNAFGNTPSTMKIYVPSALVESYKTASNWSNYASQIEAIQE